MPIIDRSLSLVSFLVLLGSCSSMRAGELRVDFAAPQGEIRPLHGVNGGPLVYGETVDLTKYWRTLQIPITRLHDCEWPRPDVVDLHAIFPALDADPSDPRSYQFSKTDDYLQAVIASGCDVVYRLGESIEHSRHKYHVVPPADYEKWAEACVGIIRHYNEGWADGFHYQIRYWEIWNEPENRPAMWTGSDDDYFRLYAVTARKIKSHDPQLKVGGPSTGAPGEIMAGRFQPSPFVQAFVAYCQANDLPLDFFSWHTYSDDPAIYAARARGLREWLNMQGFPQAEIHLNEWNYLPDNDWTPLLAAGQGVARQQWYERMGGPEGAAFLSCVLMDLQESPVDVANYYSGDINPFGLFTRDGVPKKTYFAMRAFQMLRETPRRVHASGSVPGQLHVAAGLDAQNAQATVLISNYRHADREFTLQLENLPWPGSSQYSAYRLDARHDLGPVDVQETGGAGRLTVSVPAGSVLVLRVEGAD